jgi:hypothetical protein
MQNLISPGRAACEVCGGREVHTDMVEHGAGWLLLAACPRCDHRWTQRLADAPTVGRAVRVAAAPEVANAA